MFYFWTALDILKISLDFLLLLSFALYGIFFELHELLVRVSRDCQAARAGFVVVVVVVAVLLLLPLTGRSIRCCGSVAVLLLLVAGRLGSFVHVAK